MTQQNKSIELANEWLESTDQTTQAMVSTLVQQSKEDTISWIREKAGDELHDAVVNKDLFIDFLDSLSNTP